MKKVAQIIVSFCLAFAFPAIAPAQTITSQPQSITVNNASTAAFTVGASNATSYQWRFQGSNIVGATSSALTLEDVSSNQAGSYTVIVNSSVTSSNAVLTIVPGTIVTFYFSGLLTNAVSTNMQVQLFDHDKPATVENFIHYIRAGGYSNMFIDRCLPGFIVQGGDYGAMDRTNTSSPITGWSIASMFTHGSNQPNPPYPYQVDNEYNVGPVIHNRLGTIAMALGSGEPNSASSAFFFNLMDNSATLDSQDFTVFGRIIDANGTNVLQYFNQLSVGQGGVADGEILLNGQSQTQPVPSSDDGAFLPVDYIGTIAPGNSNLVFCGFLLSSNAPVDTNPPTVSITSPAAPALLTNALQGTASDDVGLAVVICILTPQAAADGTYPYPATNGASVTNYNIGTTNWSISLNPGNYEVSVQAQDGAGNLSPASNITATMTAVLTNGNGTVSFTNGGVSNLNAVGYPFQQGSNYNVVAAAGAHQLFVDWTSGSYALFSPVVNFTMADGVLLTATFISNGIPNGVAFTFPASNAIVSNATFNITGTISNVPSPPAIVTCQIYSTTTYLPVGPPLTSSGAPNWSVTASNFVDGSYAVEAVAVDAASNSTVVTENFAVAIPAEILSPPQSVTVNNASTATFTVGASNAIGYQWQFQGSNIAGATSSTLTLEDVNSNQAGSYTVIVSSAANSVTSSPPAVLTILNGTIVQFILYGLTNGNASNVVNVQLFDHDKPATVANFLHYIRAGGYTNMFFDRCVPEFVLQGGDYGATDRTNTSPPMTGWDIASMFTYAGNQPNPPYPHQVANEYNVGPLIHNRFGTIAMALAANEPNSANSAFFFNLVDNSGYPYYLDDQDFTVFGRIVDANGTNVLDYFNALTNGNGLVTNGVFFDEALQVTKSMGTNLPVNYAGSNAPANANLVFCDFTNMTMLPVDTIPPTVSITSPMPGIVTTGSIPPLQGTATDDVGLADVFCVVIPQAAGDGTYPNGGVSVTNYALGTSNWSVTLSNPDDVQGLFPPGSYSLSVQSQDGAGNLSEAMVQPLIITAIITNGIGTVTLTQGAFSNLDAVGYPFQIGSNYILSATPGNDQVFVSWASGGQTYPNPEISFDMGEGLLITANFTPATNAPLNLNIVGPGTVSGASNGEPILVGTTFQVTATPNPGQSFYAWNNGTETSLNPMQTYTMAGGLTLTALFITNNNSNLIAFTYPKANGLAGTNTLNITGTISNAASTPVNITCQVFSSTNLLAVTQPLETSGTTNWVAAGTGLGLGSYILVATAVDAAGDSTLIIEDFSVAYAANLQLIIVGQGSVSPVTNGEALPIGTNFQVSATPGSGQVFYTWNNGTQISTNAVQTNTMAYGLTLTATFIPSNTAKGISFTYPAAKANLSTNTFSLKGKIASSMKSARVTCQFFQTNGLAVGPPMTTSATNNWAIGVTNLPGGIYMVIAQATNASGKSTIVSEEFGVLPFAAVQGTYSGLFICTNGPVAPTNSGFLTFTLTPSGLMSGKLEFPAYPPAPIYSIPFENISFTLGFAEFSSTNFHGNPLLAAVYLNLTDGSDVAYGTISSEAWSSQLFCYREVKALSTNTTPPTGKYIFSLQPGSQTNGPTTNGYASLAVARDGAMALSGALPDNTTFSQSARVSKEGIWPLYVVPSGVKNSEMLMGWEIFSNSGSCNGQVLWYKAPDTGSFYTEGVGVVSNMALNSTGTNFSRPATGSHYSIVFTGGTIVPPLTNGLQVNNAGQFVVTGGPADKLKISLSANGVITGSILVTKDNKTLRFSGAFISPAQGGSGFIPDVNGQTGSFDLHQ